MVFVDLATAFPHGVTHRIEGNLVQLSAVDQTNHKARNEDETLRILDPAEIMMVQFAKDSVKRLVGMNQHHENQEKTAPAVKDCVAHVSNPYDTNKQPTNRFNATRGPWFSAHDGPAEKNRPDQTIFVAETRQTLVSAHLLTLRTMLPPPCRRRRTSSPQPAWHRAAALRSTHGPSTATPTCRKGGRSRSPRHRH